MKTLKKILVLMLALSVVLSFAACGSNGDEGGSNATPRPTAKTYAADFTAEQLNNYYVAYTVTKAGDLVQDEAGNYIEKEAVTNYVEVGYASLVITSEDGGATFNEGGAQCFTNTANIEKTPKSVFNVHMNYEKDQLENKGTETVAGRECTNYYFKNGPMEINMYVDETFGSTGVCLKYVAKGPLAPQTIEVTELKFGVINVEEGYDFVNFQSKLVTPAPATEKPEA